MTKAKYNATNHEMGEKLRMLRYEKGMSVVQVSIALEINDATYRKYESGERGIPLSLIKVFCDFFDCDIDYLFGNQNNKRKTYTDIHAETGLSEEAIAQLKECNEYSHTLITSLNGLFTHGLIFVCDAVTDVRIKILGLHEPPIPKDVLNIIHDGFLHTQDETIDDVIIYLEILTPIVYSLNKTQIDSLTKSYDIPDNDTDDDFFDEHITLYNFKEHAEYIADDLSYDGIKKQINDIASDCGYDTSITITDLVIMLFLSTYDYINALHDMQVYEEYSIPHRVSVMLHSYFTELMSEHNSYCKVRKHNE